MESLSLLARRALYQSRHSTKPTSLLSPSRTSAAARSFSSLRPLPRSQSQFLQSQSRRPPPSRLTPLTSSRFNSSSSLTTSTPSEPPTDLAPAYQLTFTCRPCSHRSAHRVTKQGYHKGTVLITCPNCKNRHVIADHLKVFLDEKSTLEDILAKANVDGKPLSSLLKKGKLGIRQDSMVGNEGEEDIEFWEDGTETVREKKPES